MTNNIKGPDFSDAIVHEESAMNKNFNWGDFNDAPDQQVDFKYDLARLKDKLILQLPAVLRIVHEITSRFASHLHATLKCFSFQKSSN